MQHAILSQKKRQAHDHEQHADDEAGHSDELQNTAPLAGHAVSLKLQSSQRHGRTEKVIVEKREFFLGFAAAVWRFVSMFKTKFLPRCLCACVVNFLLL